MHLLKNPVLTVLAGAAVVVGGVNVASYAVGGHHAKAPHHANRAGFQHVSVSPRAAKAKVHHGAYVFKVPKHTGLPFSFQLRGVPKGHYVASLNVGTTTPSGPVTPFCGVGDSTSPYAVVSFGQSSADAIPTIAVNSATGIVKVAHQGEVSLDCEGADETYNTSKSKNVLVLTPVKNVATVKGHPQGDPLRNGRPHFGG